MRYAYVFEGAVHEIIEIPDGSSLADFYHPSFAACCVELAPGSGVAVGWLWDAESRQFSAA